MLSTNGGLVRGPILGDTFGQKIVADFVPILISKLPLFVNAKLVGVQIVLFLFLIQNFKFVVFGWVTSFHFSEILISSLLSSCI